MIDDLDASLKALLAGEAKQRSELANAKISFAVPDKDWRAQGGGLALNVYLYRAVENRALRSNERRSRLSADGKITDVPFPIRLECSYVISAWNKAVELAGSPNAEQEHRLLSQVLYVLWRNPTMPSRYLVGLIAEGELPLPIVTAESEDMAAKPDFWTSLDTPVRPSITCHITLAMNLDLDLAWKRATTIGVEMGGRRWFTIGGTVRNAQKPTTTVNGAWIRVDNSAQMHFSDLQGNFLIEGVEAGGCLLTVRAAGFREANLRIEIPEPSGSYDVVLTPI
jgi:hypothetical protein